jgi:hypothetical protein
LHPCIIFIAHRRNDYLCVQFIFMIIEKWKKYFIFHILVLKDMRIVLLDLCAYFRSLNGSRSYHWFIIFTHRGYSFFIDHYFRPHQISNFRKIFYVETNKALLKLLIIFYLYFFRDIIDSWQYSPWKNLRILEFSDKLHILRRFLVNS